MGPEDPTCVAELEFHGCAGHLENQSPSLLGFVRVLQLPHLFRGGHNELAIEIDVLRHECGVTCDCTSRLRTVSRQRRGAFSFS